MVIIRLIIAFLVAYLNGKSEIIFSILVIVDGVSTFCLVYFNCFQTWSESYEGLEYLFDAFN